MEIETLKFGKIDIDAERIFKFELPILGFEELKKFVILDMENNHLFRWLQSVENPAIAFPIVSVFDLNIEYSIDLADETVEALNIKSVDDILVMNMSAIPAGSPKDTTINLLAPLIFNTKDKLAGQIILSGSGYDSSFPLLKKDK